MQQLALDFDAPTTAPPAAWRAAVAPSRFLPLPAYDRLPVGVNQPLSDGEIAALAHHGYRIGRGYEEPGGWVYDAEGPCLVHDDVWADDIRVELDLLYLEAKALEPAPHPLEGL